jgi:hypothetical protein
MADLEVTPAQLQGRSVGFLAEAMQLRALGGRLDAALADAQAAVAGLASAQAIQTCRAAWSADLVWLSLALGETGDDLADAAVGYDQMESHNAATFDSVHAQFGPRPSGPGLPLDRHAH